MNNLNKKTLSGLKWTFSSQSLKLGSQLLTIVILANLLKPEDFGLVAMANVALGFVNVFKDLGTAAGIIQKKKLNEEMLSSIFFMNIFFGTLITITIVLISPLVAEFYSEPKVIPVLIVLSMGFFLSSFSIIHQALFEKQLKFKIISIIEITAVILSSLVGVTLAILDFGVWSLVSQTLTLQSIQTILLWLNSDWRPKFIISFKEINNLKEFTLNLIGFNVINYFARNADYLLIGRYLGAESLGLYTIAYRILLIPVQNISGVISRVIFPVFSSLQIDNKLIANTYLKVIKSISFITFPLMLGIFVSADLIILVFFSSKWNAVIPILMILSIVGLMQSIGTTVGSIYLSKGKTSFMFYWALFSTIIVVIAFYIGLN